MWPWEHLAFGYLLYSLFARARYGRPPEQGPAIALAIATQFPDLIDKPLAWTFDVLPTARTLGHSVFFAAGLIAVVAVAAWWLERPAYLPAVSVGYLSHLAGDVLYAFVWSGSVSPGYLLWPLVTVPARETPGLLARTGNLLAEFVSTLGSPAGRSFLLAEATLLVVVLVVWSADGWPGLRSPG